MSALIDHWDAALREPGFSTAHFRGQLRDGDRTDPRPVAERSFGSAAGFDLERLSGPDLEAMNDAGLIGDDDDVEPGRRVDVRVPG